ANQDRNQKQRLRRKRRGSKPNAPGGNPGRRYCEVSCADPSNLVTEKARDQMRRPTLLDRGYWRRQPRFVRRLRLWLHTRARLQARLDRALSASQAAANLIVHLRLEVIALRAMLSSREVQLRELEAKSLRLPSAGRVVFTPSSRVQN